jgi:hypothetical protein
MSKLFFDHLLELKQIDKKIKEVSKTPEEREELWRIVDEIIHHKIMGCVLDNLPIEHHHEFLEIFHGNPHSQKIIFDYLKTKGLGNFEELLKGEIVAWEKDLIKEFGN